MLKEFTVQLKRRIKHGTADAGSWREGKEYGCLRAPSRAGTELSTARPKQGQEVKGQGQAQGWDRRASSDGAVNSARGKGETAQAHPVPPSHPRAQSATLALRAPTCRPSPAAPSTPSIHTCPRDGPSPG